MAEVERQGSARIFISYRREDSAGFVRAMLDPASRAVSAGDRIFKDTDNIPPGEDFVNAIQRELESCRVLLAVIGRRVDNGRGSEKRRSAASRTRATICGSRWRLRSRTSM